MKFKNYLIFVFFSIISVSCAFNNYDITIKNVGSKKITDAHVKYDKFVSVGGVISPSCSSVHSMPGHPIPVRATVEWQSEGIFYQREVDVRNKIPVDFRGEIQFIIDENNEVTVITERFHD